MTNSRQHQSHVLQDRYGLKVAARLSEGAVDLPNDISERLRAARVQALSKRKIVKVRTAPTVLTFGDEGLSWWRSIAFALLLIVLVSSLIAIHVLRNEDFTKELAEVDAALLTDDLPPAAYADPGFVEFLKSGGHQNQ